MQKFRKGQFVKITFHFHFGKDISQIVKVHSVKNGITYVTDRSLTNRLNVKIHKNGKSFKNESGKSSFSIKSI